MSDSDDDDDLPIDIATLAAIEGDPRTETTGKGDGGRKKKEEEKARFRRAERANQTDSQPAPQPARQVRQAASPRERLISMLTAGRGPDPEQQAIINAVEAGFGISDADPMWIFLLPTVLKSGRADDVAEVRELVASIKSAGLGQAGKGMEELSEAQRETTAAINSFNLKQEKAVERAVSAALAKYETGAVGIDQAALARSVSDSIGSRLMPARVGLVAGALAIVAALSFVAGVMINKSGYDKYIAELEGKIQGYQSVIGQQKGAR